MSQPLDLRECMELPERDRGFDEFAPYRWNKLRMSHIVAAFLLPTPRHLWSHNPLVRKPRRTRSLRNPVFDVAKARKAAKDGKHILKPDGAFSSSVKKMVEAADAKTLEKMKVVINYPELSCKMQLHDLLKEVDRP